MNHRIDYLIAFEQTIKALIDASASLVGDSQYDEGVRMGYFQAVSIMLNELETMGISRNEINLEGFKPESMLSHKQAA